jgi:hypothetical protein
MGFQLIKRAAMASLTATIMLPFAGGLRSLAAQATIRGILYDDAKGTPVRGTVMLVDPATDAAVVHVAADSLGRFALNVGSGTYQLAAVRPGYTSVLSAPIPLLNGESMTLKVPIAEQGEPQHQIGVTEHVKPDEKAASQLESMRKATAMSGFEMRRRVGTGMQFDRRDFDKSGYRSLGEFLQGVPGVRVLDPNSTSSMQMARSMGLNTPGLASSCHMGWFIDGHRMDIPGRNDPITEGLGGIQLDNVEAVEVFRGLSEMPAEFAAPDLRCGAVAIWSRKG